MEKYITMDKSRIKIYSILISFGAILLICICFFGFLSANSLSSDSIIYLFASGQNNFLWCDVSSSSLTIFLTDKNGTTKQTAYESLNYQNGQMNSSNFFVFCENDFDRGTSKEYAMMMLICDKSGAVSDFINFDDIDAKINCSVYDASNQKAYFVDEREPKYIKVYNENGVLEKSISVGQTVQRLFVYNTSEIYAITSNGVYSIGSGSASKIGSLYPDGDFRFYDEFCCTSDGEIYTFSSQTGFSVYCQTDYQYITIMNSEIYAVDYDTIYKINTSGEVLAKYTVNDEVTDLCANSSLMAFVCDKEIHIISDDSFITVSSTSTDTSDISNSDASSSQSSGSTSKDSDASSDTALDLSSDTYDLSNNIIEISVGTTIAQFKKAVTFTGYTATFSNYSGVVKTSGVLGTGATVTFSSDTKQYTFTFLVYGDVTGEGNINSRDMTALSNYLIGAATLSELQQEAADLNQDGVVDSADLFILYNQIG